MVDEDEGSRKEGHEASVPNDTSDGYLVLREATDEEKEVELKVQQKIEALKRAHEGSRMVRNNINILYSVLVILYLFLEWETRDVTRDFEQEEFVRSQ